MIIVKFRQDLLHYSFAEKHSLRTDTELVTILLNGSHLTIIQIDNLPMLAYKRCLLFLEILRIYTGSRNLLLFSHFSSDLKIFAKVIIY